MHRVSRRSVDLARENEIVIPGLPAGQSCEFSYKVPRTRNAGTWVSDIKKMPGRPVRYSVVLQLWQQLAERNDEEVQCVMYDDYLWSSHPCLGDHALDRLRGPGSLDSAVKAVASSIADRGV